MTNSTGEKTIRDRGLEYRVTVGRGQVAISNRLVQISGLAKKVRLVLLDIGGPL